MRKAGVSCHQSGSALGGAYRAVQAFAIDHIALEQELGDEVQHHIEYGSYVLVPPEISRKDVLNPGSKRGEDKVIAEYQCHRLIHIGGREEG